MLRLSRLADYGTVIMAEVARAAGRPLSASEAATTTGIAQPTAGKLMKILARGRLLRSHRGARGGYTLGRDADDISIADIVEALEGPLAVTECCAVDGRCALESRCAARAAWTNIDATIRRALGRTMLAEFARPVVDGDSGARREAGMPHERRRIEWETRLPNSKS